MDNVIGAWLEGLFANSGANQGDSFNGLTTELLVGRGGELIEETDQELEGLPEVRGEVFLVAFGSGSQSSHSVLFNDGDTGLNHGTKLGADNLGVWLQHQWVDILEEVGARGACVSLNAGDGVVESLEEGGNDRGMVGLLEVLGHVVGKLTDRVEGSVSNLWVRVLQVLDQDGDHGSDFLSLINIFADLRERHDTSMLVAPVDIISDRIGNELSRKREHQLFSKTRHQPINTVLSELDIVLLILLNLEALLGSHPVLVDLLRDVNH